jgi:hypothetical protein
MENSTTVVCPICGGSYASLSSKHLKKHGTTIKQLRFDYPDVIIYSDAYLEKKQGSDKKFRNRKKLELDDYFKKYREKHKDKRNEYQKQYRLKNLETVKRKDKIYCEQNKDKKREYDRKYRETNKERLKLISKTYRLNNKEIKNAWTAKYNKSNPHIVAWRRILVNSLRNFGTKKEGKTIELLGYSAIQLKNHLEAGFTDGMNWENYGEWHIDHIKPICTFPNDAKPSEVNALSNLRPLWATSRIINGVFYEGNLNRNKF